MSRSGVRQRSNKSQPNPISNADKVPTEVEDAGPVISLLDITRVIATLIAISCSLSYYLTSGDSFMWGYNPWFLKPAAVSRFIQGPLQLTPSQLLEYDGADPKKPIYLAINGTIYDVSEGRHTYGPGGSYSVFAGRDATRAFVTGCFLEDRTSDLRGAEEIYIPIDDPDEQISSGERKTRAEREKREAKKRVLEEVQKWADFYGNSKKYFKVGKLVDVETPTGSPPKLCDSAQKGRPKRKKSKTEGGNEAPGKPVQ